MEEIHYCSDCTHEVSRAQAIAGDDYSECCGAEIYIDVEWIIDPDELDLDDRY